MYVPIPDRDEDEVDEDLMDLIDPDEEYAVEIKVAATHLMLAGLQRNVIRSEAEYERALLRSVELASGEWIV